MAAMEFKEAEITTIKNIVEHDAGTGAAPAKVSEKIQEKSKVSTAASSMAELTFADTSITRMGANTQFSFQSKERLVKLEQGTVLIHTPPGNGGATVDCGGVTGAVSGTTFMASRDASGNTMFVLLEGQGGLKVTVGGSSTVIRPGQAASVGADAVKEAKSSSPGDATAGGSTPGSSAAAADDKKPGGAGGSGQGPASSGGEGSGSPAPAAAPKIQVFEVDVKKVITTSPLVTDFKNELPSAAKIEKTVEVQQKAVQEGKLEKLEVEVVAVKSKDGDLLVGAPKVEKEEMVVVNKKAEVVQAAGGNNLDVDTAAGPGAGAGGVPPDARPVAAAPAPSLAPQPGLAGPLPGVIGQIAGQTIVDSPPTSLKVTVQGTRGVITLDRVTRVDRPVVFSGFGGLPTDVVIKAGSSSVSFTLPAKRLFPGFVSTTDTSLRIFDITATSGALADTVSTGGLFPAATLAAVNPARDMMEVASSTIRWTPVSVAIAYEVTVGTGSPVLLPAGAAAMTSYEILGAVAAADVKIRALKPTGWVNVTLGPNDVISDGGNEQEPMHVALDAFFYFQGSSPSALGLPGPTQWFADLDGVRSLAPGTLLGGKRGPAVDLGVSAQDFDFYAAGKFTASSADEVDIRVGTVSDAGILVSKVSHAKTILYANEFDLGASSATWAGLSTYDATTAPDPAQPLEVRWAGYFGQFSDFMEPTGIVWDDVTGGLVGGFRLFANIDLAGMTLAAGDLGFHARGMDWVGNGSYGLEITSVGDVDLSASRIRNVGATTGTGASSGLRVESQGKVKMGGAVAEDQVRLEAALPTATGGATAPNLAVIRTGDSLELRNVVIRGFDGTRLEKVTTAADGTQTLAGRVLVSGSSVRDFKIKELVGAAVNADAKIQMMAMDNNGILAGDMLVEGSMPVATKLASALAATDEVLPTATASAQVHAQEINLAADRVNFNGATLTAMNAITARANTVLVQNSFMTVVRNTGMINMYVQQGLLNRTYGTVVAGQANFAGNNTFQIGSLPAIVINSQATLDAAYGSRLFDTASPLVGGTPQAGAINVLKL